VISVNPYKIVRGQSITASWSSTNATSASIHVFGSVPLNGSRSDAPQQGTTYRMTVTGPGGTAYCEDSVIVEQTPPPPPPPPPNKPACVITVSPYKIQKGEHAQLSWSSTNTTGATINVFGSVPLSGSQSVSPHVTTQYHMTVTGPGGTAHCDAKLIVEKKDTPPPPPPPPPPYVLNPLD
jgi:hypothetical protein